MPQTKGERRGCACLASAMVGCCVRGTHASTAPTNTDGVRARRITKSAAVEKARHARRALQRALPSTA